MEWKYESFSDIFHGTSVNYKAIVVTNKQNIERPQTAHIGSKTISIDFIGLSFTAKNEIGLSCGHNVGMPQSQDVQHDIFPKEKQKISMGT